MVVQVEPPRRRRAQAQIQEHVPVARRDPHVVRGAEPVLDVHELHVGVGRDGAQAGDEAGDVGVEEAVPAAVHLSETRTASH